MNQIKTGVIGLGRMGKHHCRIYANQRDSQLVGVFDINCQLACEIADLYGVQAFDQLDDLLERVDAVTIATPTPTHFHLVKQCFEHKVNVLVEKPITETLEDAEVLVDLVNGNSLIVQVGHIERFNPTFIELKKVLENLKIIAIGFRRLSPYRVSNKDVDVVLDLMVHDLDLTIDLMGGEPHAFSAYGLMPFSQGIDHAVAQLFYFDGPIITLTSSRVTEEKIRAVDITAEEAYVEADFLNKSIHIHRCSTGEYSAKNSDGVKYHQESLIERILVPSLEPLGLEVKHFLDCIANQCTPSVSAFEGMKALRLAQQIRSLIEQQCLSVTV